MSQKQIIITKENGEEELFDREKLITSLKRSGAQKELIKEVANKVERQLRPKMRTSKIYKKAFDILKKKQKPVAARYSLQRVLMEFGPSGYPFEYFVKELFSALGKKTYVRKIIRGACVEHEVDVVSCSGDDCRGIEAKFHNEMGLKSDLKTVLYVKARYDDIMKAQEMGTSDFPKKINRGMLVTNTKFSDTAIKYAECAGLELLGWNYPNGNTLQDYIEKAKVHPVTALTTLTQRQKRMLLKEDLVLCKTIKKDPDILRKYGIKDKNIKKIVEEAEGLFSSN